MCFALTLDERGAKEFVGETAEVPRELVVFQEGFSSQSQAAKE